jgi:hypothetical protein
VKRCSCTSKWTPKGCLLCRHNYHTITETVTAFYSGSVNYSGSARYDNVERQIFTAKFTDKIKENVSMQYEENIPYSGNHTA